MSQTKLEPRFILAQQQQKPETIEIGSSQLNIVLHPTGQQAPVHGHHETHVIFVRSGRMTFDLNGQIKEVGPGDIIIAPPNVVHMFKVTSEEPCQTVCLSIPERDRDSRQPVA